MPKTPQNELLQADKKSTSLDLVASADKQPLSATPINRDELLSQALSEYLEHPTSVSIETTSRYQQWSLVCGRPIELSGAQLDYLDTSLAGLAADGLVDDYFCALLETDDSTGAENIRELVAGSSDSPLVDWIEKHNLPESILDTH